MELANAQPDRFGMLLLAAVFATGVMVIRTMVVAGLLPVPLEAHLHAIYALISGEMVAVLVVLLITT